MSASTTTNHRGVASTIGLGLAVLLGVGDIVVAVPQFADDLVMPLIYVVFSVLTLASVPFAWRGAGWARILIIVTRLLAALLGVPAFFVPDVPAGWVAGAAGGILLAVLLTVLLLVGARHTHRPVT